MALYVRIQNNAVTDCWDTPPPAGQDGWKSAVEVRPAIQAGRQGYTAHRFDLNANPVQIIWDTYEISVDDRKGGMKSSAGFEFQQVVNEQARNPDSYSAAAVETARQAMITKQAAIDACATHDALDAL